MRALTLMAPLLPVLALVGCASARSQDAEHARTKQELADALKGATQIGQTECIDPQFMDGPQIIGDHILLYRNGRKIYRNNLLGPCPSLDETSTLIVKQFGSQLCRHDQFRVRNMGESIPSAFCQLGNFTVYQLPKKR